MKYSLSNDTWGNDEIEAAHKVIDSRNYTMGEMVREYEREFSKRFGVKYSVMSNSGSSANLLAMAALRYSGRLKPGDEVLVTAVSWSTTYFPVSQMGFKLRFVDIDLNTLNVSVDALKKAITPSTRAILAVNLLGNPNEFDKIFEICDENNLLLIEDNCESMGAMYRGKNAGTFGLIGSYSTYYSHHLCTMEGGMSVTDDEELYHYMLAIRSHGWTRHLPDCSPIHSKVSDSFYESFNFIVPGFNLRPVEIEAAVGIEQLKKLDIFIEQRRKNAKLFKDKIESDSRFLSQVETGMSSWFGFAIILSSEYCGKRDLIVGELRKAGIEVRPIVSGNFTRQKALEYLEYSVYDKLNNADYIHDNGFFVGNHSVDMEEQINYLFECLNRIKL